MRQSSESQTSGGWPFCARAVLVLLKALRSITVASSNVGEPLTEVGDADGLTSVAAAVVTRRGLVAGAALFDAVNRCATGIP
jgi:hypothetical protein